jgi:hypothetical protein
LHATKQIDAPFDYMNDDLRRTTAGRLIDAL